MHGAHGLLIVNMSRAQKITKIGAKRRTQQGK
jgi:hypothetical protein